jgi:hypothetical protein
MTTTSPTDHLAMIDDHRRAIRYAAAALSLGCAALYFLVGLDLVYQPKPGEPSLLLFGVPAGLSFVLGAVLLVASDRRVLWVLGAIYQVLVIVAYIGVADRRDPPFEPVGVTIKVAQFAILILLLALAMRPTRQTAAVRPVVR